MAGESNNRRLLDEALIRAGGRPRFSAQHQTPAPSLDPFAGFDPNPRSSAPDMRSAISMMGDARPGPLRDPLERVPVPDWAELAPLQREEELRRAGEAGDRAAAEFSPLGPEWGWADLAAGTVSSLARGGADLVAGAFGDEQAQRRTADRGEMISRGVDQLGFDALSDDGFIAGISEAMEADAAARGPRDPLQMIGDTANAIWRGPSDFARQSRRDYRIADTAAERALIDTAWDNEEFSGGRFADAADAEAAARRAAADDLMTTGSGALEFIPGVGLVDLAAPAVRATGRAGFRAAGAEIPDALAPRPRNTDFDGDPLGPLTTGYREGAPLREAGQAIREGVENTPVLREAARYGGDWLAGTYQGRAAAVPVTAGAAFAFSDEDELGDRLADTAIPAGAAWMLGGLAGGVARTAPRVIDDINTLRANRLPETIDGEIINAEFAPDPFEGVGGAMEAQRAQPRWQAAVRDPETGQVYTGVDHVEAIDAAPDGVRERLDAIYRAPTEDPNAIGFSVDGEFMSRDAGLASIREAAGRVTRPPGLRPLRTPEARADWAPEALVHQGPDQSGLYDIYGFRGPQNSEFAVKIEELTNARGEPFATVSFEDLTRSNPSEPYQAQGGRFNASETRQILNRVIATIEEDARINQRAMYSLLPASDQHAAAYAAIARQMQPPPGYRFDSAGAMPGEIVLVREGAPNPQPRALHTVGDTELLPEAIQRMPLLATDDPLGNMPSFDVRPSVNDGETTRLARAGRIGFDTTAPMYHGSPDARQIRDANSFERRSQNAGYLTDPERYAAIQQEMAAERAANGVSEHYLQLLEEAGTLNQNIEAPRPVYLSSREDVARTYARDDRAWDYQNAEPEVIPLYTRGNLMIVEGAGERFANLRLETIRESLPQDRRAEFDAMVSRYKADFTGNPGRVSTNDLEAIAHAMGFDGFEVRNVRDTYQGEGPPATVRAIFDPSNLRSPRAAFDPARSGESDLLAGIGTGVIGGTAAAAMMPQDAQASDGSDPLSGVEDWALPAGVAGLTAAGVIASRGRPGARVSNLTRPIDDLPEIAPGPLSNAAPLDDGVLMFAGRNARTADHQALARAEQMASEGASRDDIWRETGWFQGVDGKWRFEINDRDANIVRTHRGPAAGRLEQGLIHPELFEAYPDMRGTNFRIEPEPDVGGSYRSARDQPLGWGWMNGTERLPPEIRVEGSNKGELRSATFHEGQHNVQDIEGFARGGSPDTRFPTLAEDPDVARLKAEYDAITEDMEFAAPGSADFFDLRRERDAIGERLAQTSDFTSYRRLAGETEARNVQTRRDFTPEQRRARPPWETQDIPDDQQIVRFDGGVAESAGRPRTLDLQAIEKLVREEGITVGQAAERLGYNSAAARQLVRRAVERGEIAPLPNTARGGRPPGIASESPYDETDLINAAIERDAGGNLVSIEGIALDLRDGADPVTAGATIRMQMRSMQREIAGASGDPAAMQRLATRYNTTPETLAEFAATNGERRGASMAREADRLIASGVTDHAALKEALRNYAETNRLNANTASVAASQARMRAKLTGNDPLAALAIGVLGAGGAALWADEAGAEPTGEALFDGRSVEMLPSDFDIYDGEWEGGWQQTALSDGSRALMRPFVGQDGQSYTMIATQGRDGSIDVLGYVTPTPGAPGPGAAPIGDMYPNPATDWAGDTSEPYMGQAGEEVDQLDPFVRAGLDVGGAVLTRAGAARAGVRGAARDITSAIGGAATDMAITRGEAPEESAIFGAGASLIGRSGEMALARGGEFDFMHAPVSPRAIREDELLADPGFLERTRAFARELPEEAPRARVARDLVFQDEGETAMFGDMPHPDALSPRSEFLAASPIDQLDWMNARGFEVTRAPQVADRGVIGVTDSGRSLDDVAPLPELPAVDPAPTVPMGNLFFDDAGAPVFGREPKPRRAPTQRPPLEERAATGGAKDALAGANARQLRAIAADYDIETEGLSVPQLRRRLVTELGREFDSTAQLVSFLRNYGVKALPIGVGAGVGAGMANQEPIPFE